MILNVLTLAVLAGWVGVAIRKYRRRNDPTEVLPGSRNIAMKEILERAQIEAWIDRESNKGV